MEKTNKQNKNTEHNVMTGLYPDKRGFTPRRHAVNGGIIFGNGDIAYNENRQTVRLEVRNTGDRPIQVGSHFHFFEVNRYLQFDRDAAFGCHLNIPATTAVRFEPGDTKTVELVTFAGKRRIIGFNNLVMGYTGDEDAPGYFPARTKAFMRVRRAGFKIAGEQSQSANAVYASDTAQAAQTDIRHDENHARTENHVRTENHARAAAPKTKKTSSAMGRKRKNE